MKINVTKAFLPPKEEYLNFLNKIWENNWLTNNGPLLIELETELKKLINNDHFLFVGNGTIALQLAIKSLNLTGEIITTPYSYCATTTSIMWENCIPIFCDINETDFNINPDLIENSITERTTAILATHVYGLPCDVKKIENIAKKHNLKVIYDAAHAFGCELDGDSLLNYGDISTCSFHATKVFHTIEGGSVVCKDKDLFENLKLIRSFGHINDDYFKVGINAKNSEFHAAMGLANLPYLNSNIEKRKRICNKYDNKLDFSNLFKPYNKDLNFKWNYSYYPVVFNSENELLEVISVLNEANIFPRRYFFPSLNELNYLNEISKSKCPVSESISKKVICLPLYPDLEEESIDTIIDLINKKLKK